VPSELSLEKSNGTESFPAFQWSGFDKRLPTMSKKIITGADAHAPHLLPVMHIFIISLSIGLCNVPDIFFDIVSGISGALLKEMGCARQNNPLLCSAGGNK